MSNKIFSLATQQKLKSLVVVSTCSVGVFSAINVYKGNERFYKNVLMPVVHLLPPEFSHQLAVAACKYNLFPKQRNDDPVSLVSLSVLIFDALLT